MTNLVENGDLANMCERLIQVSFSKIVSSKSERGGAKLRKNLLILHLLQRARTEQKSKFSSLAKSLSEIEQSNTQDYSCNDSDSTFTGQYDRCIAHSNTLNNDSSHNDESSSTSRSFDDEICQSAMNNGLNLTCIRNDAFQNSPTPLFCEADDWSSNYNSTERSSPSSSSLLLLDMKPYSNGDHSDLESSRNFDENDDDEDSFISVDDTCDFDINNGSEKSDKEIIRTVSNICSPSHEFSYTDGSDSHRPYNNEHDGMSSFGNPSSSIEWFDHYRPKNMRRKRKLSPIAAGQILSSAPSEKRSCGDSLDESLLSSSQFSQCDNSYNALDAGQSSCELQGLISVFKTGMTGVGSTTTTIGRSSQSVTAVSESIDVENDDGANVVGEDGDIQQRDILLAKKSQKTSLTEQQAILELTCAS